MKHTISNSLIIFSFFLMAVGCTQNYYVTVRVPESNVIREDEKDYSSTFDAMFELKTDMFNIADTLQLDTCLLLYSKPPKGTVFAN